LKPQVVGPLVVAGYSVGELAAWGVAGLLEHAEVLNLAGERAAAMDEATIQSCGLVAILGLTKATVDSICRSRDAYVAIVNGERHLLVGGTWRALEAVILAAQAAGARHSHHRCHEESLPEHIPVDIASATTRGYGGHARIRAACVGRKSE